MTGRACDVAVLGGGPAGMAAAMGLARAGQAVAVIAARPRDAAAGQREPRRRPAETLPPRARLVLGDLGAWERFHADPAPGMTVAWGGPEPFATDFVANPYGCAWHVDRDAFDKFLASEAERAGVELVAGRGVAERVGGRWRVRAGGRCVEAGLLIDATGRTGSRRRVRHDRLVALTAMVARDDSVDARALIEAGPSGWWYSAPHGDRLLAVAYMTDADLCRGRGSDAWSAALTGAPLTRRRIKPAVRQPAVQVVAAASSRANVVARDGWVAVGDAAAAHDPLAGQGVVWALESGLRAANAIVNGSVDEYGHVTRADYDRYLSQRRAYYTEEQRWPFSPFWQRRHR